MKVIVVHHDIVTEFLCKHDQYKSASGKSFKLNLSSVK